MATVPKRSTSGIMSSVMNQPMLQQQILNERNIGQDKRAVGSRQQVLGQAVRGERSRLLEMDKAGLALKSRRDKLGFSRQIFQKRHSLALDKMKRDRRSNKLATMLGGVSTVASGFNIFSTRRKEAKRTQEHKELMNLYSGATPNSSIYRNYRRVS